MNENTDHSESEIIRQAMSIMGQRKKTMTPAAIEARRTNGAKGGRPRGSTKSRPVTNHFVDANKKHTKSNPNQTTKMKITISHDQDGIDPSATYTAEQFVEVRKALEAEYEKAILAEYPEAEIDFGGTDTTYAIRVTEIGIDDPSEIEDNVQSICETVFATGNFWL